MIKKLVIYLVIASTFKQNECSPTKEQDNKSTESIERDTKEPIWPLSKERQEKDDKSDEIKTYSKQKEVEIEISTKSKADPKEEDEKLLETITKSTQKEEKVTKSAEIKTHSKEKKEIKTNSKGSNDKATEHTISKQKEERDSKETENVNALRTDKNTKKRANGSKETKKLLQALSEVATDVNYNKTPILPFPLVTMDGESHKKTAELIRMIQNADFVSRDDKLSKPHPVKVNLNLDSYNDKTRELKTHRRANLITVRHIDSPENPKDERRYLISNFDVLESYIESRRSKIDPFLSRKSTGIDDQSEGTGSESSEWATDGSNEEEILRAKENETEMRQENLNYNDKSDDYILTTKRNVWDYEHENWAAAAVTQKVNWDNIHSSGEKETDNSDQSSFERKEVVEREQEESKEKEHEHIARKKKHKKREDDTTSSNRKNLTKNCDDKDIIIKVKTIPDKKDINTLNELRNRELDTSVQEPNQHTKDDDDSKKKHKGKKRHDKKTTSNDDETPNNTKKKIKRHQNQDKNEIKTKLDVVNHSDRNDVKHRGDRSNKIKSLQNLHEIVGNQSLQTNRKKLAKRIDKVADKHDVYGRKQKTIRSRLKNKMEPKHPDIPDRQERRQKQRKIQEVSERSLKQQKNIRTDKDNYYDNPDHSRITKRTSTDDITDGVKTKKRGRKDRALDDYKDSYDYRSSKKKSRSYDNKKDYIDYNNPKDTHKDYDKANNERADQGQNIGWLEERNDRKKEEPKYPDNGRIDMDYNKFENKKPKSSDINHDDTRQGDKINWQDSREAKPSKNKFSEESINSNRNKNMNWKDSKEALSTTDRIVKDIISGDALKKKTINDRNSYEPWDRHANNDWDKVGVSSGKKKEVIRTTKGYNDYNEFKPKRTSQDYHDDITTEKNVVEKQAWNKHDNNNWDLVGVDLHTQKSKSMLRGGRGYENKGGPRNVRTALPFRERKSVYSDDNEK